MTTSERQCTKCGQFWPRTAEYWHVDKECADGLRRQCKKCRHKYYKTHNKKRWQIPEYRGPQLIKMRRYRQEKLDIWRQYDRDRWQDSNRKAQNRAAVEKRDAKIAADLVLKEKHMHRRRELDRKRHQANSDKARVKRHNRRGADGRHTDIDIQRITREQNGKCYWCGGAEKLTVDHHIPLSRGGTNWPSNIVMACHSCNSRKRHRLPIEYRLLLARREGASAPSPTLT